MSCVYWSSTGLAVQRPELLANPLVPLNRGSWAGNDVLSFSSVGNFDKGPKDLAVGLADLEFRVPLDAETKAPARILDALDDAVLGDGIDDEPGPASLTA